MPNKTIKQMTTKQDYKNKVMEEYEEVNKKCDGAYGCGQFPPELKSFLSSSIDEAIELAFRECGVEKMEDKDEAWNELCKLDVNDVGLAEGSMILFNHCIDERSILETKFLEK